MSTYVFDIETDSLEANELYCIVAQHLPSKKLYSFPPDKLNEGLELLKSATCLIGHNILGFDLPKLEKLTGINLDDERSIIDTLVLSRLFKPTREGGHSLESWGYRLNKHKLDFAVEDFGKGFTPEMLAYCEGDVELNTEVYLHLKAYEAQGFSEKAIQLEHEVFRIIRGQMGHGFLMDMPMVTGLEAQIAQEIVELEDEVHKTFVPKVTKEKLIAKFTASGELSKMAGNVTLGKGTRLKEDEYNRLKALTADLPNGIDLSYIVRHTSTPFNLGSTKQIGEYLQDFGWVPKKFTPTGQPIVDDKVLTAVRGIPEAALIAKYLTLKKRLAFVSGWIKDVNPETNRLHGYVNTLGAVTNRMTHSRPNVAQTPSSSTLYGTECRGCFTVPKGYKLVGADASGLELRVLAHYMGDEDYANEIINGDVHQRHQGITGIDSRDKVKTFIYAFIYGAGDKKLGSVIGGGAKEGKRLRASILDGIPALKQLQDRVAKAARKGYLNGLDGRRILVRSPHAALNTAFQSAGAIIMKVALVLLSEEIKKRRLDAHFVANIHDEFQIEVREDQAEEAGSLAVWAIQQAGVVLNLRVKLDGEYKVGNNWAETH